jgi:pantoate kinase
VKKTAKAFAPAAISSFFEIYDKTSDGKPIFDLEKLGARGGGFGLQRGVLTTVNLEKAQNNKIKVFFNSKLSLEAKTTLRVAENLLKKTTATYEVTIEHIIEVPIGTGFGTSAGGALTTGLALKHALELPLTHNQIGKIAHVAEIECQTGLGTVSALTLGGGCILVVDPGAPGICQIDRIPITPDYVVVAGFFKSNIPKHVIFSSPRKKEEINRYGSKTLEAIMAEPSLENFLKCCWDFAQKAGFATKRVHELVKVAKLAGAIGSAQNMVGEAVHSLVHEENARSVEEAFKRVLPSDNVIVSKVDFQGARLVDNETI